MNHFIFTLHIVLKCWSFRIILWPSFTSLNILINKVFQLSEIPFFLHLNEVNANVAPIKIEMQKYESNLKCLGLFFFFLLWFGAPGFPYVFIIDHTLLPRLHLHLPLRIHPPLQLWHPGIVGTHSPDHSCWTQLQWIPSHPYPHQCTNEGKLFFET